MSTDGRVQIVVEKLTKNVNEDHLREIFGAYGDIQSIDLPMNRQYMAVMTNRGTAYICYYDAADAESAIAHMHEGQLDGAVLSVSIVLPRRTFSRSPPPARISTRPEPRRPVYPAPSRYRSPPRRRFRAPRGMDRHDLYRPRSVSRSRSRTRSPPPPARSPLYSSRSPTPPPRRRGRRDSYDSPRRRRRGSSYDSLSNRSRSPSRSRYSRR
ncbi:hypothetical protein CISG_06220 [Coccidioides immitis RMSCC 3703]|uniref:RRM domain-containing protein n=1 Tax=Coccidioides immitis RMSCC 3703 TaxID=454286 RepID=A0A0J8QY72_COCIT|nr:hypothetical protein CISG_06220 [Coccidioides immitis RMSCC 3703]